MEITMTSEYPLKAPRTFREACLDIGAAHVKLITRDCDTCPDCELCAVPRAVPVV